MTEKCTCDYPGCDLHSRINGQLKYISSHEYVLTGCFQPNEFSIEYRITGNFDDFFIVAKPTCDLAQKRINVLAIGTYRIDNQTTFEIVFDRNEFIYDDLLFIQFIRKQ